jgi:hypothetical protein
VGTWHDLGLGRPIAAPLEQCAELVGVDLATVRELAANIEPYLHADGTRIWSLMQLERQLRPEVYRRRLPRPPTDPSHRWIGTATVRCMHDHSSASDPIAGGRFASFWCAGSRRRMWLAGIGMVPCP